ncbi:MAG: Na+/H+ antiporter NhaC family protein [Rikenellaceae bacterium]|nr:Na+/H+ antiporter NhaC family protein [Rikenellaceae bacterium]
MKKSNKGIAALLPLVVFLGIYLIGSVVAGDFYKIPITVAGMIASVVAVMMLKGMTLTERVDAYSRGATEPNIMLMIWIFVLAGAFAASTKQMGAVDATVALTMRVVPVEFLPAGVFLAACFTSLSVGTSVGTIVALTPIASALASSAGCDVAWMVAIVVGGALFGDNLSFISDTTIAATRTQGCSMRDKFRTNAVIVIPAAVVTLLIYCSTSPYVESAVAAESAAPWYLMLPYLLVLATAIAGVNVLIVLVLGIVSSGIVGIASGRIDTISWIGSMGEGISGMGELIIITMMAGGMLELIRLGGGIDFLIRSLSRHINSRCTAEGAIGFLVVVADVCTANNTVAIISVGSIVREIAEKFGISARRAASLLDTFSCFAQGFLPYGAQLLMAAGLASVSPVEIIPHLYYPFIMGGCALLAIILQFPRYDRK